MKKNFDIITTVKKAYLCCFLLSFCLPFMVRSQEISFSSSGLTGESINNPTSLDFGPDNKLYVSQQNGIIWQFNVERDNADFGEGSYTVTETNSIDLVQQNVPNHTDDGLVTTIKLRQITGIKTAGTAENPVLYVTSSDNLIGGGGSANDVNLDTNSGMLSKLTFNGTSWSKVDLVRGLPRCEENHSTNGMDTFTKNGETFMLIQQGGHTNMGAPSNNFVGTPEYFLSGSILVVNLTQLESMPTYVDPRSNTEYVYDLPTLNDPDKADIDNTNPNFPYPTGHPLYNATIDLGDPFGGNDGKNMSFAEPGGPVQIFSAGYRNAYDVVVMENGNIYTYDNGPNNNWGGFPVIYTANGTRKGDHSNTTYNPEQGDYIINEFNENGTFTHGDQLHYVGTTADENETYYGGHPIPIAAFPSRADVITYKQVNGEWTEISRLQIEDLLGNVSGYFNAEIGMENFPDKPEYANYTTNLIGVGNNILDIINSSTNGICEYTASTFDNALKGNLFSASFNGNITRYAFNETGDALVEKETIFSGFGGQPLDVIATSDDHIFPGTIWSATYGADNITIFEPTIAVVCIPEDSPEFDATADYDNDGFTNQDEIDNGTNFCSGGSIPGDNDNDSLSDLNDTDDDNDGILDSSDPFVIDPNNGLTTNLPIDYSFFNNDPGTGFFGLGFTGLMLDPTGNTDYLDQFDLDNLSFGGAAGKASIDFIDNGDPYTNLNSQNNAFQLGINVDSNSPNFTIQSRVESPFFGIDGSGTFPEGFQSVGIYIGTGDQDNYLKFVIQKGVSANDSINGMEILLESEGNVVSSELYDIENILSGNAVDMYVSIKPSENTGQLYITLDNGQSIIAVGDAIELPANFLDPNDNQGLAVGIIATSSDSIPFSAVWDYFLITEDSNGLLIADTEVLDFGATGENSDATQINLEISNEGSPEFGALEVTGITITGEDASLFSANVNTPINVGPGKSAIIPVTAMANTFLGTKNAQLEIAYANGETLAVPMTIIIEPNYLPFIRINAGGTEITATDGDINWHANSNTGLETFDAFEVNTGNIASFNNTNYANRHSSIPSYIDEATFSAIFSNERWDPNTGEEMEFSIPVPNSTYLVNLFVGNAAPGTTQQGERVYDILIENEIVQNNLDLISMFGNEVGGMLSFVVDVEDELLNISFGHVVENPLINAIEIQRPDISFDPITVEAISDLENTVGDQIDFAVSAANGEPFLNYTYSIEGQPEGVEIEPTNGQIFGFIDETALDGGVAHDGDHSVTVTVSQENGQSVSTSFSWLVTAETCTSTTNVALNKTAIQSTNLNNNIGFALSAVDGDTSGIWGNGSVTHTLGAGSTNPWWRVDLDGNYTIEEIVINNRTDCCSGRLNGAIVYIGSTDSTNPSDFTEIGILNNTATQTFSNLDVNGSYVMVQIPGDNKILSLAEVQVFGCANTFSSSSATSQLAVNTSSSIFETSDYAITVYPNPAINELNANLNSFMGETVYYAISAIAGNQISTGFFESNHNSVEQIDLQNIASGIYFLSFNVEGKDPIVVKFVIQ